MFSLILLRLLRIHSGLEDSLRNNYYKYYALTPQTNANGKTTPQPPVNPGYQITNEQILLNWQKQGK